MEYLRTSLGFVPVSPYLDKRQATQSGVPVVREYRACYTNYREAISQMSATSSVMFLEGMAAK
ncbi:hypothetical protein [Filimonas lacunae]|uniref:hypothetical protein n=1 Tax=Filimonas lacunae TaxID=477680 RepID=UPI0007D72AB2|nr:hypothetical protein [Filimonas lacunae]BAV07419.1 hypothetical protein FLA_3444 [Filimonas lacunae]